MRVIYQDDRYRLIQLLESFILLEMDGEQISRHIYNDEKQAMEAMDI